MKLQFPRWLIPGKDRSAVTRLPSGILFRDAAFSPKFLLRWYLLFASIFIPIYLLTWAIAELSTWVGVLIVWSLIFWALGNRLATFIVFPGSNKMTSRSFELSVALEVKNRIDSLAKEISARCDQNTNLPLPKSLVQYCETFLLQMHASLSESLKRHSHIGPLGEEFVNNLESFITSFKEWKVDISNRDLKSATSMNAQLVCNTSQALLDSRQKLIGRRLYFPSSDSEEEEENEAMEEPKDEIFEDDIKGNSDSPTLETGVDINNEDDTEVPTSDHVNKLQKQHKLCFAWNVLLKQIKSYYDAQELFPGLLSFEWARVYMEMYYNGKIELIDCNSYKVDVGFFQPDNLDNPSKKVVIMCNPNAGRFEQSALHPFWLDFYRERGLNVLVWNYRGFGRSEGSPSPKHFETK